MNKTSSEFELSNLMVHEYYNSSEKRVYISSGTMSTYPKVLNEVSEPIPDIKYSNYSFYPIDKYADIKNPTINWDYVIELGGDRDSIISKLGGFG